jgi:Na+/H+ antiporter NhaD/arsenite permease-like protein
MPSTASAATIAARFPRVSSIAVPIGGIGSLATILWLADLRERGLEVSPLEYLRLGLSVVPAMLIVTSLWLWLVR